MDKILRTILKSPQIWESRSEEVFVQPEEKIEQKSKSGLTILVFHAWEERGRKGI